ncbi:MAG: AAA family ATPase [Bacteroidetes bacterium]|nr:AAA family ATPase [Bacteroidota bacterium]
MRFETIKLSEQITKNKGIGEINMQRLSNVVALVGKNGSGKSRILDLIEENIFNTINIPSLVDNSISHLPKTLENLKTRLQPLKDYFIIQNKFQEANNKALKDPTNQTLKRVARDLQIKLPSNQIHNANQAQVANFTQQLDKIIPTLKPNHLRRISNKEIQELQLAIEDAKDNLISFETLFEKVRGNTNYDEFKSIHRGALKFLSKLPHQLAFDKYDCIANDKVFEDRISYKRFQSLKKFIKDFLSKELTWEQKIVGGNLTETGNNVTFAGLWKINGRLFNYGEFSDGEKTLFAYALLFFLLDQNPDLNIKESVILIDEPELHLHPNSEIDLIEGIKNVIGEKGQLIIATHSINILSMLNYEEIFMVKDGQITHPSQVTPGKSLTELMGIEERLNKLSDFVSSISTWTYVNFMAQCFSNPEVIESAKVNDPQIEAFKQAVSKKSNVGTNMFLDFGAGKGRLLEQIKSDNNFIDSISYSALEPVTEFHSKLTELGAANIYTSYSELPQSSFDFILLCNVLHEIPVDEWEQNINKIIFALKPSGHLIIIEAKVLTKGEKIGKIGYLLLDLEELQQLFKLSSLPSSIKVEGGKTSVTCAVINKSELTPITREDIVNTLIALETNTLKKIESMRGMDYEAKELYGAGRKTAFLSQLHINAKFAKEHILNNKN